MTDKPVGGRFPRDVSETRAAVSPHEHTDMALRVCRWNNDRILQRLIVVYYYIVERVSFNFWRVFFKLKKTACNLKQSRGGNCKC